jgi:hypothetical protein
MYVSLGYQKNKERSKTGPRTEALAFQRRAKRRNYPKCPNLGKCPQLIHPARRGLLIRRYTSTKRAVSCSAFSYSHTEQFPDTLLLAVAQPVRISIMVLVIAEKSSRKGARQESDENHPPQGVTFVVDMRRRIQ